MFFHVLPTTLYYLGYTGLFEGHVACRMPVGPVDFDENVTGASTPEMGALVKKGAGKSGRAGRRGGFGRSVGSGWCNLLSLAVSPKVLPGKSWWSYGMELIHLRSLWLVGFAWVLWLGSTQLGFG